MDPDAPIQQPQPSVLRWTLGFLLVGMAWGFTTPFMRKAAVNYKPTEHPSVNDPSISMIKRTVLKAFFAVLDMLRRPAYLIPFLLNITGSVWFFLLIGQAELSLTVPIVNSLAFLFTVVGEWWAEGKVISRGWTASSHVPVPANEISDTWLGMSFVLSGIGLCVYSKS